MSTLAVSEGQETFYDLRTEQQILREAAPVRLDATLAPIADVIKRDKELIEWESRHFGEARWHSHVTRRNVDPKTGKDNFREKVTNVYALLNQHFPGRVQDESLYVLFNELTDEDADLEAFATLMKSRIIELAEFVAGINYDAMSLENNVNLQAYLRRVEKKLDVYKSELVAKLVNTDRGLGATLRERRDTPFLGVLALGYHGTQALLTSLQATLSRPRAVAAYGLDNRDDFKFLADFWKDTTSAVDGRTGILPELGPDCFGSDVNQRLRMKRVILTVGDDPITGANGEKRVIVRPVLQNDPASGRGVSKALVQTGRPDVGTDRDPVNDAGIYNGHYVCCNAPLNDPGCFFDVYDRATTKSKSYKIGDRKRFRPYDVGGSLFGKYTNAGQLPDQAEASVKSDLADLFYLSIRRGTAWINMDFYDKLHTRISQVAKQISPLITVAFTDAVIGFARNQVTARDVILSLPAHMLNGLVIVYTLVAEYNRYRCMGRSMGEVPQTPADWIRYIDRELVRIEDMYDKPEDIPVDTANKSYLDFLSEREELNTPPASKGCPMFTDEVMNALAGRPAKRPLQPSMMTPPPMALPPSVAKAKAPKKAPVVKQPVKKGTQPSPGTKQPAVVVAPPPAQPGPAPAPKKAPLKKVAPVKVEPTIKQKVLALDKLSSNVLQQRKVRLETQQNKVTQQFTKDFIGNAIKVIESTRKFNDYVNAQMKSPAFVIDDDVWGQQLLDVTAAANIAVGKALTTDKGKFASYIAILERIEEADTLVTTIEAMDPASVAFDNPMMSIGGPGVQKTFDLRKFQEDPALARNKQLYAAAQALFKDLSDAMKGLANAEDRAIQDNLAKTRLESVEEWATEDLPDASDEFDKKRAEYETIYNTDELNVFQLRIIEEKIRQQIKKNQEEEAADVPTTPITVKPKKKKVPVKTTPAKPVTPPPEVEVKKEKEEEEEEPEVKVEPKESVTPVKPEPGVKTETVTPAKPIPKPEAETPESPFFPGKEDKVIGIHGFTRSKGAPKGRFSEKERAALAYYAQQLPKIVNEDITVQHEDGTAVGPLWSVDGEFNFDNMNELLVAIMSLITGHLPDVIRKLNVNNAQINALLRHGASQSFMHQSQIYVLLEYLALRNDNFRIAKQTDDSIKFSPALLTGVAVPITGQQYGNIITRWKRLYYSQGFTLDEEYGEELRVDNPTFLIFLQDRNIKELSKQLNVTRATMDKLMQEEQSPETDEQIKSLEDGIAVFESDIRKANEPFKQKLRIAAQYLSKFLLLFLALTDDEIPQKVRESAAKLMQLESVKDILKQMDGTSKTLKKRLNTEDPITIYSSFLDHDKTKTKIKFIDDSIMKQGEEEDDIESIGLRQQDVSIDESAFLVPHTDLEKRTASAMYRANVSLAKAETNTKLVIFGALEKGQDTSSVIGLDERAINRVLRQILKAYDLVLRRLGQERFVNDFDGGPQLGIRLLERLGDEAILKLGHGTFEKIVPFEVLKNIGFIVSVTMFNDDYSTSTTKDTLSRGISLESEEPGLFSVKGYSIFEITTLLHRWGSLAKIFAGILSGQRVDDAIVDISYPWRDTAIVVAPIGEKEVAEETETGTEVNETENTSASTWGFINTFTSNILGGGRNNNNNEDTEENDDWKNWE